MSANEDRIVASLTTLRDMEAHPDRHMFVVSFGPSLAADCFRILGVRTVALGDVLMVSRDAGADGEPATIVSSTRHTARWRSA